MVSTTRAAVCFRKLASTPGAAAATLRSASQYRSQYHAGMTKTDKTLARMRANPRDWRIG